MLTVSYLTMIKFFHTLVLATSTNIILGSGGVLASGGDFYDADRGVSENSHFQYKYDLGKRVMESKILCEACPLAGTELNGEGVQLIAIQLKKNGPLAAALTPKERKAAEYYMKDRFF